MKRIIATLTNIAYFLAGLAQYVFSALLLAPSLYLVVLTLGSGYHHYHAQPWSKKYDFLAMYAALTSSICFGIWAGAWPTWFVPVLAAGALYLLFKSSPGVVVALVGILFTVIWIQAHPIYAVGLAGFSGLPFIFNMLGDTALRDYHDPVHGIGWHVPTAAALMAANLILLLSWLRMLPV